MIDHHKTCLQTVQQLLAVVNAIQNAKSEHVQDHIKTCLTDALEKSTPKHQRIQKDLKYL